MVNEEMVAIDSSNSDEGQEEYERIDQDDGDGSEGFFSAGEDNDEEDQLFEDALEHLENT